MVSLKEWPKGHRWPAWGWIACDYCNEEHSQWWVMSDGSKLCLSCDARYSLLSRDIKEV